MSFTPLVDAALADPLSIPPGLDEVLRRREAHARQLLEEVSLALAAGTPAEAFFGEVRDELKRFLQAGGAFPRLLRRPLTQIALGQPAMNSFDRFCAGLFSRATDALAAAEESAKAAWLLERLAREYQERFPASLARLTRENRATEGDVRAIRRAEDARAFLLRLERVRRDLEVLRDRLPRQVLDSPPRPIPGLAEPLTVDELLALFEERLFQRAAFARDLDAPRRGLRAMSARHLRSLGDARGWTPGAQELPDMLAQAMAERTLAETAGGDGGAGDAILWMHLLDAADRARRQLSGGWFAQVAPRTADDPQAAWQGTDYFVVPLGGDYVAITTSVPSPVRVRESREGVVECSAFWAGRHVDFRLAELDIAPLFTGLDRAEPGWYCTERTAQLRLLAKEGDIRFARVVLKGSLLRTATPASRCQDTTPGALRILHNPATVHASTALAVEVTDRRVARGWGVETRTVASPFPGRSHLWLRQPERGTDMEPLEREKGHLAALQRVRSGCSLEPLGRGCLMWSSEGILYDPPLAWRVHESPMVAQWLEERPEDLVPEGEALHELALSAGIALGLYHTAVFAYAIRPKQWGVSGAPSLVLIHAPWATPLGEHFPEGGPLPEYKRLRYHGVAPQVSGGVASRESDRAALSIWVLELLALRKLPGGAGPLDWEAMLGAVTENAHTCFRDSALALRLADELRAATPI